MKSYISIFFLVFFLKMIVNCNNLDGESKETSEDKIKNDKTKKVINSNRSEVEKNENDKNVHSEESNLDKPLITESDLQITQKSEETPHDDSKFEKVEIIKDRHIPQRTAEYSINEDKPEMKLATLIGNEDQKSNIEMTERPNFLSSVIRSHETSVLRPKHIAKPTEEGSLTFDLEAISK